MSRSTFSAASYPTRPPRGGRRGWSSRLKRTVLRTRRATLTRGRPCATAISSARRVSPTSISPTAPTTCYVVCEPEGVGSAVLIRALRPAAGAALMERRRGRPRDLCNGPGRLTQALGVDLTLDGQDITSGNLIISGRKASPGEIVETTRIGISRGTELPWRYLVEGDEHVSVPPKTTSGRR